MNSCGFPAAKVDALRIHSFYELLNLPAQVLTDVLKTTAPSCAYPTKMATLVNAQKASFNATIPASPNPPLQLQNWNAVTTTAWPEELVSREMEN